MTFKGLAPTIFAIPLFVFEQSSQVMAEPYNWFPAPLTTSTISGDDFGQEIDRLSGQARESKFTEKFQQGQIPSFLKKMVPVSYQKKDRSGQLRQVTIWVTPDYLAIGTNDNYLRMPVNWHTVVGLTHATGMLPPTAELVDRIYEGAQTKLKPRPLPPGPQMVRSATFVKHNQIIEGQLHSQGHKSHKLVAGHKKDIVLTGRLGTVRERIAIYGWHRPNGRPIQPLSTVHGAEYLDYSHGIRLVHPTIWVDGEARSYLELLKDPNEAVLINKEGTMLEAQHLLGLKPQQALGSLP